MTCLPDIIVLGSATMMFYPLSESTHEGWGTR